MTGGGRGLTIGLMIQTALMKARFRVWHGSPPRARGDRDGAGLVLVADGVEIPGNLGTLLRTLDACGADCLVLTNRRARLNHPKVFRGSRGMLLRVPIIDLGEPDAAIGWLRERDFTVYLATPDSATPYHCVEFADRTALVVGNERYGISRPWLTQGFAATSVPMLGVADSLNVSVCASILLYAARARMSGWNVRDPPPGTG